MTTTEGETMSVYGDTYPAEQWGTEGGYWGDKVVKQGHADYCAANGHAHTVEGRTYCARCGAEVSTTTEGETMSTETIPSPSAPVFYPEEVAAITDAAVKLERAAHSAIVSGDDVGTGVALERLLFVLRNVTERAAEDAATN